MAWKYRQDEINAPTASGGLDMATAQGTTGRPSARLCHTGGVGAIISTDGVNAAVGATTEMYVAELFVPATCLVTGIALFNGSNVTDDAKCGLYDKNGTLIRATAGTQQVNADTYQLIPFATGPLGAAATTVELPGPATYYIGVCYDGTTSTLQTFGTGTFGAGKLTGLVYATNFAAAGTALTITPPTTFTTLLGPLASLY